MQLHFFYYELCQQNKVFVTNIFAYKWQNAFVQRVETVNRWLVLCYGKVAFLWQQHQVNLLDFCPKQFKICFSLRNSRKLNFMYLSGIIVEILMHGGQNKCSNQSFWKLFADLFLYDDITLFDIVVEIQHRISFWNWTKLLFIVCDFVTWLVYFKDIMCKGT